MAIDVIGRLAIGTPVIGKLPIIVDSLGYIIYHVVCKFEQETALLVLAVAGFCAIRAACWWLMVIGRLAIGTAIISQLPIIGDWDIIGQLPIIGDWDKQISAGC